MNFPVFRKYAHERTFFKINSLNDFEELNIIGNYYSISHFEVKIFSDRTLINDMISNTGNYWKDSKKEEYESMKEYCLNKLNIF